MADEVNPEYIDFNARQLRLQIIQMLLGNGVRGVDCGLTVKEAALLESYVVNGQPKKDEA